ncbi:hypothetical protein PHYSODRAFT_476494 [Phytophthora sojae]|uniref:Protein kinase domain-containing protein n=1 Tax=Phytophthora sojae (strain P6497) TaxID=1094619 RepID=G4YKF2_PHYSP|nr:hypothetical protein PHYSODRAFT_476494 [Phytophthora sojae]EGZ28532.1 hypothetical protein PHYSODRAFT_476494 [Phytophthora sojae]|eukprot:XP_009515807.1 hypothetical protein PHYSODRAFT_476494 [Phytophthora sojae]
MELFRREADHWFMLNHQNVVYLYGACHVGTPFFVCEPAKSTSLTSHYLHERGIVHCDLKGNNFMVGTDGKTIKLGDFGMMPWKAPEYLKGEDPTVMSDVYGFGMCILELISGTFPWAGLPEAAVKFHWSLIQHMCCYEPSERISLDAVVDMLHTFRFE